MDLRTAVLVCNETSRRWINYNILTHLFNARKASLASVIPFFSRIWNAMGVNQTSYRTYPTQIYTFQLNVWARWCLVVRFLSYVSRS
jgi:hypothetical protein